MTGPASAPPHLLDNPIRASLDSRHATHARRRGPIVRYPADIAPFLAADADGVRDDAALQSLVAAGERVYLLGPVPVPPPGWTLQGPTMLAQMICSEPLPLPEGAEIVPLDERRHDDVLALAALVYPHYFRPRTPLLGRYFGIYRGGRLAAMIGERMGSARWREVSAVCVHPQHAGQGHARRLLTWLSNDLLARGEAPFLHVSLENHRAIELYERNGYITRARIPHWSLQRPDDAAG